MADDPRIELPPSMLINPPDLDFTEEPYDDTPTDRLRALLADEDRAEQLLRRAIADPGQFLRRAGWGTDDAESITSWSARAVLAALQEVAGL